MAPPEKTKTVKLERYGSYLRPGGSGRLAPAASKLLFRATLLALFLLLLFFTLPHPILSRSPSFSSRRSLLFSALYGGGWEAAIRRSAEPPRGGGLSVLVTGAAGFIGTHCSLALKERGDGVVGLDNFNAYYATSLKRRRAALLSARGVFVAEGDLNDGALLAALFRAFPFTHVLHLAAQAGVRYAMRSPQSYVHSNVAGFVSLLEAAAKRADPPPAVVWASSSSVYGLNEGRPFSEAHRTDRPASLYAATKKAGEEIAHVYNHIYGLSLTGLRFFTVYGPWGRPDMAYFSFTRDILAGKHITVFEAAGGGEVARDFTFIGDVVEGCLAALDTAERSTGAGGGGAKSGPAQLRVYNLGNTSPVPVTKLVAILESLLGVKAKKRVVRMPANGDVFFTHANVSLARRELGYRPATSLAAGLRKFVDWYVDYYGVRLPATAAAARPSLAKTKRAGGGGGGAAEDAAESSLSVSA
ncbi:unnamed protein product [Spirodela intermedia]|uniref:UDP-glucuronate 4-epimerase n=1 Tax=Spirodela intermedia TaxID=51605 RepID=A0A7I8KU48_SPIIN|nr:unnamed protein product [Spirodela intermedia]